MGYKKIAFSGISWMMSLNVVVGLLSVIKIATLARLLMPSDFGLLGIALLSLALLELLTETGINVFLIQTKEGLLKYLDSAWVISILRGILIMIIFLISSPLISYFFNSPQALGLLYLISLVPFLRGFINPYEIVFQKELKFNYEFIYRLSLAVMDAGVSIILAVITRSVYSLVWGMIASVSLELLVSFVIIKPRPSFMFKRSQMIEIFHQGKWVTFYGILNYVAENIDDILVGRILGTYSLGIYQLAYKIGNFTVTEVTNVVNQVFFPLYSKIADDVQGFKRVFLKSTFALSLIVIAINVLVILYAKDIILIFLGQKWIAAIVPLQVLAFYSMIRSIVGYPSSFFLALKKQHYVAVMTFTRAIVLSISILPFLYVFGLVGAAYSALLSVIAETPIVLILLYKAFKFNETS